MKKCFMLVLLFVFASVVASEFDLLPRNGGTIDRKNGFVKDRYSLSYKEGRFYDAILLDFDFSKLPAMKYRTLKTAALKLNIETVKNPGAFNISLATVEEAWQKEPNLNWNSAIWPKVLSQKRDGYMASDKIVWRGKKNNFELAMRGKAVKVTDPQKPGPVAIDVSDLIRNNIYGGETFQGIVLAFSAPKPEKKKWSYGSIRFAAAPELKLVFEGDAPTDSDEMIKARTLKYFPSAHLPPVKNPYIFLVCAYGRQNQDILWNRFHTMNTDGVYLRPNYEQRGILCLKAVEMRKTPKSKAAFISNFRKSTCGVAIDEWQSRGKGRRGDKQAQALGTDGDYTVNNAMAAIREYKKSNPAAMIGVYWRGEDNLSELAKEDLPDLVIPEIYTSFTTDNARKWEIPRIENVRHFQWAKEDGYYDKVIPLHGCVFAADVFPNNEKKWTRERLEHDIRYIKKHHPRFFGQGFYCSTGGSTPENLRKLADVLVIADEILHDVYVKPAPSISIQHPVWEAKLSRKAPHVRIKVSAAAQSGRKIIQYRYFIDNRLVAETAEPELLWDVRGEKTGSHMITVHAVDDEYYRTAAQIPVVIGD